MKRPILASLLAVFALSSCETAHNAAVTTFRVVDAPAAYVRRKLEVDEGPQTTTTTTTTETTYSDSATYPPQQPYPVQPQPYPSPQPPPVQPPRRIVTEERNREPQPEPDARSTATPRKETTSTAPRTSENSPPSQKSDLPYAKPVPGKPGYVFSPYDPNGGYVDVKGYSPGQKVKDPYSGKIFLVP